jgi:hypothetical protein
VTSKIDTSRNGGTLFYRLTIVFSVLAAITDFLWLRFKWKYDFVGVLFFGGAVGFFIAALLSKRRVHAAGRAIVGRQPSVLKTIVFWALILSAAITLYRLGLGPWH